METAFVIVKSNNEMVRKRKMPKLYSTVVEWKQTSYEVEKRINTRVLYRNAK